jgi:hypothetical protein
MAEQKMKWSGFVESTWKEDGLNAKKHGTLDGETAACGAGRLIYPDVSPLGWDYCKRCLEIERAMRKKPCT